jgi:hypothetical protein
MNMISRRSRVVVFVTLLGAAGCGEPAATVAGKVTYNGAPVEMGTISFRPADGNGQVYAARITDGAYAIPDATPGSRVVAIRGTKKVKLALSSEESARAAAEAQAAGNTAGVHVAEAADYIPEDAEGNNQTIDVKAGDQTLNFDLKGAPRK